METAAKLQPQSCSLFQIFRNGSDYLQSGLSDAAAPSESDCILDYFVTLEMLITTLHFNLVVAWKLFFFFLPDHIKTDL